MNDSVLHLGKTWVNKTGINTEPALGDSNWQVIVDEIQSLVISVNGNPFTLQKHPTNNDPNNATILEINDFALNGFWDGTEHWDKAQLIANDGTTKTDWNIIRRTKDIATV